MLIAVTAEWALASLFFYSVGVVSGQVLGQCIPCRAALAASRLAAREGLRLRSTAVVVHNSQLSPFHRRLFAGLRAVRCRSRDNVLTLLLFRAVVSQGCMRSAVLHLVPHSFLAELVAIEFKHLALPPTDSLANDCRVDL